jgi:hypothetical protein
MNTIASIHSFEDAAAFLGGKQTRTIAHNTRVELREGAGEDGANTIIVRYHDSMVVRYQEDGRTELYAAGWMTKTTKDRLNAFLPRDWKVSQVAGQWYLCKYGVGVESFAFCDGITIAANGNVTGAGSESAVQAKAKQVQAIKKYVNAYVKALVGGEVPAPSGGDCWYCYMRVDGTKETLGERANSDHILDHMKESYFVPSLLVRALEMYAAAPMTMATIGQLWGMSPGQPSKPQNELLVKDATSSLTRYLKHCLGVAA